MEQWTRRGAGEPSENDKTSDVWSSRFRSAAMSRPAIHASRIDVMHKKCGRARKVTRFCSNRVTRLCGGGVLDFKRRLMEEPLRTAARWDVKKTSAPLYLRTPFFAYPDERTRCSKWRCLCRHSKEKNQ